MELASYDVKSREIGGNTYYVTAFPPLKAIELLGDLQALITTGAKDMDIKNADTKEEKTDSIFEKNVSVGALIAGIGSNLRGATLVSFAQRIVSPENVSVQRPGETKPVRLDKAIFNNLFTGNLKQLFLLINFVLEVNYEDFFEDAPNLTGFIQALTKK